MSNIDDVRRLVAEVERLREALRGLVESVEYVHAPPLSGALKKPRAALNHQGDTQ